MSGTLIGFPFSFIKTKWTCASTIGVLLFVINWFIKKDVFVTDFTNDLIDNWSSRCADFLYSILQDLTIISAPNFFFICKLKYKSWFRLHQFTL